MKNKFRFHLCLICMFVFAVAGCKVKRPSAVSYTHLTLPTT